MPSWYFERRDIKNSPSFRDGIDANTESRYRREGARFILDAGTKMMLRYDTCATGVVYFHRFYMYHSFKDFYRYVTAACCLFLAGKVEETPKKCKDIIKAAQTLLSPASFQRFGDDPREEVITMERVLLKTIKFDLQVEHPYVYMLKTAKLFKGSTEKEKTQKMAQMAWTFINDSLCTTLSLQWEPEIISVSLMYLASRLTKFEPTDWVGRSSSKTKWWQDFVEGMTLELMEDICHQVLDLYSNKMRKAAEMDSPVHTPKAEESPPPPPPPERTPGKRSREVTPNETDGLPGKVPKHDREGKATSKPVTVAKPAANTGPVGAPIPVAQHITSQSSSNSNSSTSGGIQTSTSYSSADSLPPPPLGPHHGADFSSFNPYVSSQMFASSFLSQEGSQNIQSILAGSSDGPPAPQAAYPPVDSARMHHHAPPADPYLHHHHHSAHPMGESSSGYNYPPLPPQGYGSGPPPPHSYPSAGGGPPPPAPPPGFEPYPPPNMSGPPAYPTTQSSSYHPPAPPTTQSSYSLLPPPPQSYGGYSSYPAGGSSSVPPASGLPPPASYSGPPSHQPGGGFGATGGARHGGHGYQKHPKHAGRDHKDIPALTEIKITGPTWTK